MSGNKTYGLFGKIEKVCHTKSICKNIKIEKIKGHYNKELKIPDFQRELDEIKVQEMFNTMNKCKESLIIFSNKVNPIQIATIEVENKKYKHLVIDGQHRLKALTMLSDEYDDVIFSFHLQICENEADAIEKFKECIIGQENYHLWSVDNLHMHFRDSKIYQLKLELKKNRLSVYRR